MIVTVIDSNDKCRIKPSPVEWSNRHSCKQWFCLRDPFLLRRNFLNMEEEEEVAALLQLLSRVSFSANSNWRSCLFQVFQSKGKSEPCTEGSWDRKCWGNLVSRYHTWSQWWWLHSVTSINSFFSSTQCQVQSWNGESETWEKTQESPHLKDDGVGLDVLPFTAIWARKVSSRLDAFNKIFSAQGWI